MSPSPHAVRLLAIIGLLSTPMTLLTSQVAKSDTIVRVAGENDRFFPPAVGEGLHRSIPGSRFAMIPKAGHLPMWEQPDLVNRLILEFLKGENS